MTLIEGSNFKDQPGVLIELPAGLPPILATDMPSATLDRTDTAFDEMHFFCSALSKSDGILVNTFEELEQHAVTALKNDKGGVVAARPTPPVYCIGPLTAQIETQPGSHPDYITWLDEQVKESVVFLCFGSRGNFSVNQIEEIAIGLEQSGHRFLWVVKAPMSGHIRDHQLKTDTKVDLRTVLPTGFLERTRDQGRVVEGWALQSDVLKKGSVGGFVTHCGWNSVLEAVSSGVPLAAWPLYAEQHLNRNILVELMKMAVPVKQRDCDRFVGRGEVEKAVRELMEGEGGREVRKRVMKMKQEALKALGDQSGSSSRNLARLVETWKI